MQIRSKDKERAVINKFQSLVRCGKEYKVECMYEEAASVGFLSAYRARRIINEFYRGIISDEMIAFAKDNDYLKAKELIEVFAVKFNLCIRESRLILRYIKWKIK